MTGITKDELMQMARECGLEFCEEEPAHSVYVSLAQLTNAILERAAVECDKLSQEMSPTDESAGASMCSDSVRALKINTGD